MENSQFTFENIVKVAQENGLNYQAHSPYFDRWGYDAKMQGFSYVGIELNEYIWFWFEFSTRELNHDTFEWEYREDGYVSFVERYSQNTGKSIKSFRQGWKAKERILKLMNKNTK